MTIRPVGRANVSQGSRFAFPGGETVGPSSPKAVVHQGPKSGAFATVDEITAAEKISASYVGRILRLTLPAPVIVEAILDGRQPAEVTLAVLMRPFAVGWREQVEALYAEGAVPQLQPPTFPPPLAQLAQLRVELASRFVA